MPELYVPAGVQYEPLQDIHAWCVIETPFGTQHVVGTVKGRGVVSGTLVEKKGDEVVTKSGKRYNLCGEPTKDMHEDAVIVLGAWLHSRQIEPADIKLVRPKPPQTEEKEPENG